jgi:Flp pilus assembly protein TadB
MLTEKERRRIEYVTSSKPLWNMWLWLIGLILIIGVINFIIIGGNLASFMAAAFIGIILYGIMMVIFYMQRDYLKLIQKLSQEIEELKSRSGQK